MGIGRMIAGGTVAGLGLVGVGYSGIAGQDDTTRSEDGAIIEEGNVGAFRIQIGDCLGETPEGEFESAPGVPCSEPHADEVYFAFNLPEGDGSFPGNQQVLDDADTGCLDEFEAFVGTSFANSIYGIGSIAPSESSWGVFDDREVLCLINNYDGTLKTGSAKGTAQ